MIRWIEIAADSLSKTTALNAKAKGDLTMLVGNDLGATVSADYDKRNYDLIKAWLLKINPKWEVKVAWMVLNANANIFCKGSCKPTISSDASDSAGRGITIRSWNWLAAATPSPEALIAEEMAKRNINSSIVNGTAVAQTALALLLDQMNLGQMTDEIKNTLLNGSNTDEMVQAINYLGYPIPTGTDTSSVAKIKQLYWGVYYLKTFPIPDISSDNCGQIQQTLVQLPAEKANVKQSELDKMFDTYSAQDWNYREQAITDLITKFNGLYGQLNCTANQTSTGNDLIKNVLIVTGAIVGLVILVKIFKGKKAAPAAAAA